MIGSFPDFGLLRQIFLSIPTTDTLEFRPQNTLRNHIFDVSWCDMTVLCKRGDKIFRQRSRCFSPVVIQFGAPSPGYADVLAGASSKIAGISLFANSILSSNFAAPMLSADAFAWSSFAKDIASSFGPTGRHSFSPSAMCKSKMISSGCNSAAL